MVLMTLRMMRTAVFSTALTFVRLLWCCALWHRDFQEKTQRSLVHPRRERSARGAAMLPASCPIG
jgi:hypothetical protein